MPATVAQRPAIRTFAETVAKSPAGPSARRSRAASPDASAPGRTWLDRLDCWIWKRRQRHLDAWLARSADRADLETRLKHLERATLNRYF